MAEWDWCTHICKSYLLFWWSFWDCVIFRVQFSTVIVQRLLVVHIMHFIWTVCFTLAGASNVLAPNYADCLLYRNVLSFLQTSVIDVCWRLFPERYLRNAKLCFMHFNLQVCKSCRQNACLPAHPRMGATGKCIWQYMTRAGLQVEIERYAHIDQIPPELM
jgi:hypothetical protein